MVSRPSVLACFISNMLGSENKVPQNPRGLPYSVRLRTGAQVGTSVSRPSRGNGPCRAAKWCSWDGTGAKEWDFAPQCSAFRGVDGVKHICHIYVIYVMEREREPKHHKVFKYV
jgi:hypothetical protein